MATGNPNFKCTYISTSTLPTFSGIMYAVDFNRTFTTKTDTYVVFLHILSHKVADVVICCTYTY